MTDIGNRLGDIFEDMILGYSRRPAQGIEARQRTDAKRLDPKGESPVRQDAPTISPPSGEK